MPGEASGNVLAVRRFESHGEAATEALAANLGAALRPGALVALDGDLGTGKTVFARGLCRGLGVAPEEVASPTFALMHTYAGRVPVHHLDAWMQGRGEAFLTDGGAEWLYGGGVALVEWADNLAAWLPLPRISVRLAHGGPTLRRIEAAVLGPAGAPQGQEGAVRALAATLGNWALPGGVREVAD